ncbi:family 20 glycosylhydrolase [Phyllobacterium zundukense]|uniref:N-acetyl-beta-glucosaminidase n=1 Tax=Phyllobacterium zundukense TaxID=1867719 RepID=A0A2N9VR38_9HYPH|nr:family 20 glycosylhydrolase [Phyllobacterium zundukense]ATU92388.1 hypothetical protein BLM14_12675 [Phyllobacterium zundukense]PIO41956.1 hypothetical protein B5P45_23125 [Phyllobacterium zundukense]
MKKALLATVALSILLAGCNGSDDKTSEQTSSTFTELNNRIGALDAAQKQSQATIDEQNRKIVVLTQSQEALASLQARFDALQKAYDESPKFDPETLKKVEDGLADLTKQFNDSAKFDPEALKESLKKLQDQIDKGPTSQAVTDLDTAIDDLEKKLVDATSFETVKTEVERLTKLLAGIDTDTPTTLKETLAALRKDLDGKTTLDPAEIKNIGDRLAELETFVAALAAPLLPGPAPTVDVRTLRPTFQSFTAAPESFQLRETSRIVIDSDDEGFKTALNAPMGWAQKLRFATGLKLEVVNGVKAVPGDIILSGKPDQLLLDTAETAKVTWDKEVEDVWRGRTAPWVVDSVSIKDVLKEGYTYTADANNVTLTYNQNFGAIHALQTLYQLLASDRRTPGEHRWLLGGKGVDYPQSEYRGVMIDVGRKFVSVDDLIGLMDKMSLHKLNILHLHVSDNVGDRFGNYTGFFRLYDESLSEEYKKLRPSDGKYYTKADITRLEDAALAYGIEVLPEIDLPGHAQAFISVNPTFVSKDHHLSLDVKKPEVIDYIKRLVPEFATWFRSGKYHFGADEVFDTSKPDVTKFVNDMAASLRPKVGPNLFGIWSGAADLTTVNSDITVFNWTRESRDQLAGKKWVDYEWTYFVPFIDYWQPNKGEMTLASQYDTYYESAGRNTGIPIGREIAVWNDSALNHTYGFELMNAGIRLGVPGHGLVLWNGLSFDEDNNFVSYDKLPGFQTSLSHEQSSYWIRNKYPSLSGQQAMEILLDTATFRHIDWKQSTGIRIPAASDRPNEIATDPLGWDPLDMAAAFKKAEDLVKQQSFTKTGVMKLQ